MLSLLIPTPCKRRTFLQKLHLCKKEKIIKESYDTAFGEINIYRIYYFSKQPSFTESRLRQSVKEPLYRPDSPLPEEYLKEALMLRLLKQLKNSSGKTVCLNGDLCDTLHLGEICRYAKKVFTVRESLPENAEEIYKKYGTLPIPTSFPVAADFCPDTREPLSITLPEELCHICPKEFSPLLFAGLLYKENGKMIL